MKKKDLKKSRMNRQSFFFALLLLLATGAVQSQNQSFQIDPEKPVAITVDGGSTLHDWTVTCQKVVDHPSQLNLTLKEGGAIESFGFSVEVKGMESGRGSIMNNKTYDALKAEEHPYIKYTQNSPAKISKVGPDGAFSLVSKGLLQMAGVQKEVSVQVNGQLKDGVLVFSGSHPMKMSDFQIEQPSAMFGQIKTKDEITINFEFRYLAKK